MIPKVRRCRILSRKEGSWRLGPQGFSIHVRQLRQFSASSNYRMLWAIHCDLGYTIREKQFILGIHEARVPQPRRPNRRLRYSLARVLSRGAHSSSGGVSSWTSAAARHIPHYGASYVVIGVNYAWNFTFLLLPTQSGAIIGETGTHSRGSCAWQSPRQKISHDECHCLVLGRGQ